MSGNTDNNRNKLSPSAKQRSNNERTTSQGPNLSPSTNNSTSGHAIQYDRDRERIDRYFFNRYCPEFSAMDLFPRRNSNNGETTTDNMLGANCSSSVLVRGNALVSRGRQSDWERYEELRLRELEEARQRAGQMEKTMRWWSECTANWREKWSRVRAERNCSRDEVKLFQKKVEELQSEIIHIQREKILCEEESADLKRRIDKLQKHQMHAELTEFPTRQTESGHSVRDASSQCYISEQALSGILKRDSACNTDISNATPQPAPPADIEYYRTKLQEANDRLLQEQEDKERCGRNMESELNMLKAKCEELEMSQQASVEELEEVKVRHTDEIKILTARTSTNENEAHRESSSEIIARLQNQIARLQDNYARECSTRERIEQEKLTIERQLNNIETQSMGEANGGHRYNKASNTLSYELKFKQAELNEKCKEVLELTHGYQTCKHRLTNTIVELQESIRATESSEQESLRLRARIEELKATVQEMEDENDKSSSRLGHENNKLRSRIESMDLQLDQATKRLKEVDRRSKLRRANSNPVSPVTRRASLPYISDDSEDNSDLDVNEDMERVRRKLRNCSNE